MKLLAVAVKDMRQSFRSRFVLAFMFVVPIMIPVMFYFLFGGAGGDDEEGYQLPRTAVVVVNQDAGELPAAVGVDPVSLGAVLTQILQDESLADLLLVTIMDDPTAARAKVDAEEAGVAVMIPPAFTDAALEPGARATVELYSDPALTVGPAIVQSIVSGVVDGFAASKIATGVALEQLAAAGVEPTAALQGEVAGRVTQALMAAHTSRASITLESPAGTAAGNDITAILRLILGGMLIFYTFFTGAAGMQSILVEEEKGTLPRLFTTPTPVSQIMGGKMLATAMTVAVQITVLLVFGRFVFGIRWAEPLPLALFCLGLVPVATATGLFIVSWLESTRQGGFVYGGVLTVTSMLGLMPIFTAGAPNTPAGLRLAGLIVPQGWALRSLEAAMDGAAPGTVLGSLAALLIWTVGLGGIGGYRLSRPFA
jgi:ABC-2 type transport system permease protein